MLNQTERDILAKKMIDCAFYFGKMDLQVEQVSQTINLFESLFNRSLSEYLDAYNHYISDSKNKTFPNPAQLRPYLFKELDEDTRAIEVASRVLAAVTKFGWPSAGEAKAYIGDLGWEAVRRFGGWTFICENLGDSISMTTFQAQIRDLSRSIIKMVKVGSYDTPIGLEDSSSKVLSLVNIKSLNESDPK